MTGPAGSGADRSDAGRAGRGGGRRRARECALQVLYQLDLSGPSLDVEEALAVFFAAGLDAEEERLTDEAAQFSRQLVRGVAERLPELDTALQKAAQHWRVERMTRVDRNILRLGAWELRHCPETPARVVLNEAIELAKRFGTEESGSFVNGLLDRLAQDQRR